MDSSDAREFVFLLGSARPGGNTETLARIAAERLPTGAATRWLNLRDLPVPEFADTRHDGDGVYPEPEGNAKLLLDATLGATDLVIASPLYWYSVSTSTKAYLDQWAGWMRVPGVDFRRRMRAKTMWVISVVSHVEVERADPMIGTLRLCADYFGMNWGGALLGHANRPGSVLDDDNALAQAKTFFRQQG